MAGREPVVRFDRALWKRIAAFQVIAWALLSAVRVLPTLGFPRPFAANAPAWVAAWAISGLGVSTALALIYVRLAERFLRGVRLASVILVASFLASVTWAVAILGAEPLVGREPWLPPRGPASRYLFMLVFRSVLTLGLWSALFLVQLFATRVQEERERSARVEALANQARLQLLRAQLNPHFLFNALNSVVALIDEKPRAAQTMIRDVAAMLRRSLDEDRSRATTVRSEIDFVRRYLRCEQVRFENRLMVRFEVDPGVEELPLPDMLLHPLVENAVKHGMEDAGERPLEVRIAVRKDGASLVLEVDNNGRLAAPRDAILPPSSGIGLSNVRERLNHLFPGRHAITLDQRDEHVVARIELPLPDARS